jgi:hypothetical protein
MDPQAFWTWIGHLKDLAAFLGVLLGIVVFLYWRWLNRGAGWWVWQIVFWPPKATHPYISTPSGRVIPVLVTVRFTYVNSSVFPEIVEDVRLTLSRSDNASTYELDPYAYMEADAFTRSNGKWEPHQKELFRPFLVKARSEVEHNILFVPIGDGFNDLLPGKYKALLEFSRVKKHIFQKGRKDSSPPLIRTFNLREPFIRGFLESNDAIGLLSRDLD